MRLLPKFSLPEPLRRSRRLAFARFLYARFYEVNIPQVAGSLTFTTLLALVPLFTVVIVVVSAFPVFADFSAQFHDLVSQIMMPAGVEAVGDYIFQFREQASQLTAIGIALMMITSLMLVHTIERTFNQIWRVKRQRSIVTRVLVYWALLSLGPLLVGVGMSLWGMVWRRTLFYLHFPLLANVVQFCVALSATGVLLCFLYKLVPARYVPVRHAVVSAALAAVSIELLRRGFGVYVANFNNYKLVYGTFAAVPMFLLWLNLNWIVILSGALLAASLSYWEGDAFRRQGRHGTRFHDALGILSLLAQAQTHGQSIKTQQFRRHINLGYDELGDLLEHLARKGYVAQSTRQGWMLKTSPEAIRIADLFRLFVYGEQPGQHDFIGRNVQQIMSPALAAADMTLAEFIRQSNQQGQQTAG
ncbi:YihY family inner membrane protein [Eikenella sp. Marseille-P7795]|uniref:YihY family inner membrane protein n=1 Tax=Eikenella sp. Marseille-P7795 TaxID=2866577 RepID=UPI001CE46F79|nr:YihY family inner membrane protein [Eikenella sp. Marseille-P7795]